MVVRRDVIRRYPCRLQKGGECCFGFVECQIGLCGEKVCFGVIRFQRDDFLQGIYNVLIRALLPVNMNCSKKHVRTCCV